MVVIDKLPAGVKLISVKSSDPAITGTPVVVDGVITGNFIGTVPAGESVRFVVIVRVADNVAANAQLVNRVEISDDGFYGPDAFSMRDNVATDKNVAPPRPAPAPIPKPEPQPEPAQP